MGKTIIGALITFLIIVGILTLVILLNPLRKSEDKIKEDILTLTPIGASMEEVIKTISNTKKWEMVGINLTHPSEYTDLSLDQIIGSKSIKAHIGRYYSPFVTDVEVYWGFDEEDKLIEVGIRITVDTL